VDCNPQSDSLAISALLALTDQRAGGQYLREAAVTDASQELASTTDKSHAVNGRAQKTRCQLADLIHRALRDLVQSLLLLMLLSLCS